MTDEPGTPSVPSMRVTDSPGLVRALAYMAQYEPGPEHVALASIKDGFVDGLAILDWEAAGTQAEPALLAAVDAYEEREPDYYAIVAYGPSGQERAEVCFDRMIEWTGRVPVTIASYDQVVATYDSETVYDDEALAWHREPALGHASQLDAEAVWQGLPAPAGTLAEAQALWVPYPIPTWSPPPQDVRAEIDATLPSERGREAVELSKQAELSAEDKGRLGYMIVSDWWVRDQVTAESVSNPEDVIETLADLYRGAPEGEYRDASAVPAGLAAFFAAGRMTAAREIEKHVSDDSSAKLMMGDLVRKCPPRDALARALQQEMATHATPADMDARFTIERRLAALEQNTDSLRGRPGPQRATPSDPGREPPERRPEPPQREL